MTEIKETTGQTVYEQLQALKNEVIGGLLHPNEIPETYYSLKG